MVATADAEDAEVYDPAEKCGEMLAGSAIRLTSLLGTGTYGAVYQAEDTASGEIWAVKALWKAGLDAEQLRLQRLELDINYKLMGRAKRKRFANGAHPNIVPMRFHLEDEECLYIVMELHAGDDLYDAVQELGGLDDELAKHVFGQILDAVEFAHGCGVYHRDLKPENVLITYDWRCKLCDFGLSAVENVTAELGCGSAPYMAPEARGGYKQTLTTYSCKEADVWSLGVVLLNILFACNPWKVASDADPTFEAFARDPTILKRQFALSERAFGLLAGIFQLDPARRPTIAQIRAEVAAMPTFVDARLADSPVVLSSSPTDIMAVQTTAAPATAEEKKQMTLREAALCRATELELHRDDETQEDSHGGALLQAQADGARAQRFGGVFEHLFQQFTLSEESSRTPSAVAVH